VAPPPPVAAPEPAPYAPLPAPYPPLPGQYPPPPAAPAYPPPPVAPYPPPPAAPYPPAVPRPPLAIPFSPVSTLYNIWLTGYSWQDNNPPGSSIVSHPVLHHMAGGDGTYEDPVTAAVAGAGGGIWVPGARFYLPTIARYVIVEDTGAKGWPPGDDGHLDVWIGGQGGTRAATDECMERFTAHRVPAYYNPPPGLPVIPGPVFANGRCNIPAQQPAARAMPPLPVP
jgi:hypothetical protein